VLHARHKKSRECGSFSVSNFLFSHAAFERSVRKSNLTFIQRSEDMLAHEMSRQLYLLQFDDAVAAQVSSFRVGPIACDSIGRRDTDWSKRWSANRKMRRVSQRLGRKYNPAS
jgi:hypothetical protein